MTDRPIIFSGSMVRALLAGTKTQTRRLITPGTCTVLGNRVTAKSPAWAGLKFDRAEVRTTSPTGVARPHLAVPWVHPEDEARGMPADAIYRVDPVIEVGDRLYVRERCLEITGGSYRGVRYIADGHDEGDIKKGREGGPWDCKSRPSIHMPRWASRLTLTVTEVRVERLNDISEADAITEGVANAMRPDGSMVWMPQDGFGGINSARHAFADLWRNIHGPDAWAANPWVAAISFGVIHANIDAAGGRA